ncbi:hypothetical protein L13192_12383 [Pyrenophora tritici-repentis]|nr:hypothetical protein L13192_12383 [Pyrenophora tritici-repentis]
MKLLTLSLALSVFSIVYAHDPKQIERIKRLNTTPNPKDLLKRDGGHPAEK